MPGTKLEDLPKKDQEAVKGLLDEVIIQMEDENAKHDETPAVDTHVSDSSEVDEKMVTAARYYKHKVDEKNFDEAMRLHEEYCKDVDQLMRLLIARKHNLEKSSSLFLEQICWRARIRPSKIDPATIPNALPSGAWRLNGFDKEGHPLSLFQLSLWDPSTYMGDDKEAAQEYVRYASYMMELMIAKIPEGMESKQFSVLYDLSGFTSSLVFNTRMRWMIGHLIYVAQAQYPERLHKCLLVNAPYGFSTCWSMITPFLDHKTTEKISFCKLEKLTDFVEPSVLTEAYGGQHAEYRIPSGTLGEQLKLPDE